MDKTAESVIVRAVLEHCPAVQAIYLYGSYDLALFGDVVRKVVAQGAA